MALVLANLLTLYRAELADGTVHRADQRSGDTAALARSHPAGKSRERLFGQQVLGKNLKLSDTQAHGKVGQPSF